MSAEAQTCPGCGADGSTVKWWFMWAGKPVGCSRCAKPPEGGSRCVACGSDACLCEDHYRKDPWRPVPPHYTTQPYCDDDCGC